MVLLAALMVAMPVTAQAQTEARIGIGPERLVQLQGWSKIICPRAYASNDADFIPKYGRHAGWSLMDTATMMALCVAWGDGFSSALARVRG
jgi:hypothetical protein